MTHRGLQVLLLIFLLLFPVLLQASTFTVTNSAQP